MDNKDGRRSRVPAGTFGGSNPPPTPEEGDADEPTQPGIRRSHRAPPPPPAGEPRKRYVSTLVGHPSSGSAGSRGQAVPPPAPMLAPPKWTGAAPYLHGEEPQPRVSALPPPQHVPLAPASSAEPSRSRVTTKVGHVQSAPPPPFVPAPSGLPAIGDAIQEMLDGQASVPIEVEDTKADARMRQSADEMPLDDLQIEEILESLSEPPPPLAAEPARGRGDEPTLVHAPPPPPPPPEPETAPMLLPVELTAAIASGSEADTLRPGARAIERSDSGTAPALRGGADSGTAPARSEPARPEPPRPEVARPEPPRPVADKPAAAKPVPPQPARSRRAASELGMHADPSAASLAPAEVLRGPRYRDDSQAGLGLLLLAAMAVIGVGGWLVTRGGYPGSRPPPPAQASATVEAPKPAVAAVAPTGSGTAPALRGGASLTAPLAVPAVAAPAASTTAAAIAPVGTAPGTAPAAAATDAPAIKRSAPKPRSGAKSTDPAEPSDKQDPAPAEAPNEVLKVTPHDPAAMPELPTRDDVLAALAPIRAAVAECAHGQRGVAQLDITVASTGVVTHAVVGGDFAGTSEGSCIARTARSAQFVPFQKPRFRVIYPFSL